MSLLEERKRGLTDPVMAAQILAEIPDHPLDTQRKMCYFVEPRGKRLTEYEIMNCYSQPTPDWINGGLDWGDWTQKFHGGRPSWGNETTEMLSTDWHRHRDPAARWHPVYVKAKSEDWRVLQRFLESFSADGSLRTIDPHWRDHVLTAHLGALGFSEYGLFNAHSSVIRDCTGDTLRSTFAFAALDKVDNAQMAQLVRTFISKLVPGYSDSPDAGKREWTKGTIYKSARETVESIWQDTYDWNEIAFAAHSVYDPLFGQLVRREFFQRLAPAFGDSLTPFLVAGMQTSFQTTKAAMADVFYYCLADDPEYAGYNRRWLRAWTEKWLPRTIAAMTDFLGVFASLPKKEGFTDRAAVAASVERVVSDWIIDYADKIDYKVDQTKMVTSILSGLK
jgi:methane monooxygenase component A beta chain